MEWHRATAPGSALAPASVSDYTDAFLSRYQEEVHPDNARWRKVQGAVYADGQLVVESQRSGGHRGDAVTTADPERIEQPDLLAVPATRHLKGRWLYGGNWMGQFGHFICETLTTLWPDVDSFSGIVCHRFVFPDELKSWQQDLLGLVGRDIPVRVVTESHRVESLAVPTRTFVINEAAGPEAAKMWARAADNVPSTDRGPVFLSRSALVTKQRSVPGDDRLDEAMRALGFHVAFPEQLTIAEQISLVRSAPVVAAVSGSNLHLTAFAGKSTRVIEIGDIRTHSSPLPNQLVIDAAARHKSAFVPLITDSDGSRKIPETAEMVADLLRSSRTGWLRLLRR